MGDPHTIQQAAAAPAEPSAATVAAPAAASAAAPVAPAAAASQGLEQARAEGAQAERARVSAILGHVNASANAALAQTCIAGGLTAEQAQGVLDAAPAAVAALAPAASNQFAQAMAALGNPNVSGVEAASPDGSAQAATQAATGWGKAFGTAP